MPSLLPRVIGAISVHAGACALCCLQVALIYGHTFEYVTEGSCEMLFNGFQRKDTV